MFLATFSPFVYHLISLKLTQNIQESLFSSWLVYWNRFPFWVYFLQAFAKVLLLYSSAICQWEKMKLAVWAVSVNFLHDFTLFVIDTHQIMLISLFPTPFDHFHFHPTLGLDPALILTLRPKQVFVHFGYICSRQEDHPLWLFGGWNWKSNPKSVIKIEFPMKIWHSLG